MTYHRLLVLYLVWIGLFFALVARIFLIASNSKYAAFAEGQTVTTLTLPKQRGNFYDCNGQALTGQNECWYALCIPGEESYAKLYDNVSQRAQSILYQKRNSVTPFLIEVDSNLSEQGIYTVGAQARYSGVPIAANLLGYTNQEGNGVVGLESAFEAELSGTGAQDYLQCVTNATGKLMNETKPVWYVAMPETQDVQLTLEKEIQRTAEGISSVMMEKGAIVILESDTAKVRASVSAPSYDPCAIGASLTSQDGAFLNRAFSAYSVGSVFKPVLAAAAIEHNLDWFTIECKGYVDINGQIYRCANGVPHGAVDLSTALEQSCNCYFVALGQQLEGNVLEEYAKNFGFGEVVYITETLKTASGNMPNQKTLQDLGQLANVSFGQGELLATPLQVAAMMNTIVNDGIYMTPSYVEGFCKVLEDGTLTRTESLYHTNARRVVEKSTATDLQRMLVDVVEQGIAGAAKPEDGTAGGKTGTAQTGRYDKNGEEYKDLWFAGFYPAETPKYTIAVMQDGQTDAMHSSAAIFAQLCEEISLLEPKEEVKARKNENIDEFEEKTEESIGRTS